MKYFSTLKILSALLCSAAFTVVAFAHEGHDHNKAEGNSAGSFIKTDAAKVTAEWLAQAKKDYPLTLCPVSEDKLEEGDMGQPQDYVYRQEGKPDQLVRLCCNHCVKDFKKDPAKFLKIIDDAAAVKTKAGLTK